jgi:hypothetical protein
MIIKAKFIGGNSLGYETGKEYELKIEDQRSMTISRQDGTGKCPYQSLSAFLRNWTDIKLVENPTVSITL